MKSLDRESGDVSATYLVDDGDSEIGFQELDVLARNRERAGGGIIGMITAGQRALYCPGRAHESRSVVWLRAWRGEVHHCRTNALDCLDSGN